ncbi:MAG: hypothetical protein CML00_10960 [Pseudomonas sp.]|nr:hypothetical protein [Pseudomonas sp.]
MVATPTGATAYVTDHGKNYDASRMVGHITVDQGSEKAEVDLKFSAENRLTASVIKLPKGAKAVVMIMDKSGATTTVRFTVK